MQPLTLTDTDKDTRAHTLRVWFQAVHRGRAARKAAKQEAMARHEVCEVRQKVHKKSTENPLADFDPFAEEEKTANADVSSADLFVVADRSLYCLGPESGVRHTFNDFLNHKYTGAFVLGCIILNVVILSIETPTSNISESTRELFHVLDLVLSIIFSRTHGMLLRSTSRSRAVR